MKQTEMKNRFFADPYKLAAAIGTMVFCLFLCLLNLFRGNLRGLLFLIPALPFIYVAWLYGAIVEVTAEHVAVYRFGRQVRALPWGEVAEMGVIGTKVLNRNNPSKTGALYIYFSPVQLDEDSRFQMALKWPPKDQIYLLYIKERIDYIRPFFFGKVQQFNTGKDLQV